MRFCGVCGAPLPQGPAAAARGGDAIDAQRRHITVMFADLVGSTSIAETLDPEDFHELLSGYQAVCGEAIQRFGGYVAQYQGDGVIAYFGYPRAHEDDARRAVYASLAIVEEVATLGERVPEPLDTGVQVRVGLHTGTVIAGDTGRLEHERHSVVGETLHIAARVQHLAKPGSVVVTGATLALLGNHFESHPLGDESLRGISRPIALHGVLRPSADGPALTHRRVGGGPIVDRSGELERMAACWEHARGGEGVLVHVSGEAGIGKTRLVQALRERVGAEGGAEHLLQCSPHHASTALYPVILILEQLTKLDRSADPARQLRALEQWSARTELEDMTAVPLLADLLSIPGIGLEALPGMTPRDSRSALLRVLERLLVGDAAPHPLLFVVEDLHWADPTTVELLRRIVAALPSMPVACVLTFRDEFQPQWAQWHELSEVNLGPLSRDHVREIAQAASPTRLDPDTLSQVETVAEGIPLFVEEMVKAAVPGIGARASPEPLSRVPATLHGLLAERLDRLPEFAGIIDVAAVLGREFELGLAEQLSPLDQEGFTAAIAQLMLQDVLRPVLGSRSRLEFRHALLQEAAYDRLLRGRRRTLHGQVAHALVAPGSSARQLEPERIAHHLSCAGEPAAALAYWEQAARKALKRASFLEATEHFRRGLESLDAQPRVSDGGLKRADLLLHLGAVLQAGRTPAADVEETYAGARTAYERLGMRERLVPVIRGQYLFHQSRAQYRRALALGEEMLMMGRDAGREAWIAEGHFYLGFTRMMLGDLDLARADLEDAARSHEPSKRSEQVFEAQNDPVVSALAYLAALLWTQGYAREAFEASQKSLELARGVGGPVTLGLAWGMRCALLIVSGMRADLPEWLERARTHSVEHNIGYWSNVCSIWSAWLQTLAGDVQGGRALLERHLEEYRSSEGRIGIASFRCLLASVHLATGGTAKGRELLNAAQGHIDQADERYFEPEVQCVLARAAALEEGPEAPEAAAAYERAARSARAQNARLWELRALTGLALLERKTRRDSAARAPLEALCRWFGSDSQVPDVRRAQKLLAGGPTAP
jgi:class 3 adenylate cyclase/tetratricopeptide (TPR) repeat protein